MGKKSMHYTWHYIVTKFLIDLNPGQTTKLMMKVQHLRREDNFSFDLLVEIFPISLLLFSFNLCSSKCLSSRSAWVHTFQMPSR